MTHVYTFMDNIVQIYFTNYIVIIAICYIYPVYSIYMCIYHVIPLVSLSFLCTHAQSYLRPGFACPDLDPMTTPSEED